MVVIDVVMVELNVVGVGLSAILQGELLAILDMVFKSAVVHDEPWWFVGHTLFVFLIGGLIG